MSPLKRDEPQPVTETTLPVVEGGEAPTEVVVGAAESEAPEAPVERTVTLVVAADADVEYPVRLQTAGLDQDVVFESAGGKVEVPAFVAEQVATSTVFEVQG